MSIHRRDSQGQDKDWMKYFWLPNIYFCVTIHHVSDIPVVAVEVVTWCYANYSKRLHQRQDNEPQQDLLS